MWKIAKQRFANFIYVVSPLIHMFHKYDTLAFGQQGAKVTITIVLEFAGQVHGSAVTTMWITFPTKSIKN